MTTFNVDPNEVKKFSDIASGWWDKTGDFKTLHEINPLRIAFIRECTTLKDKQVLDIGCGGGILSEALHQEGATVTGIDMSEAALSVAKLHQIESGTQVDYRLMTAEALAANHSEQYDVITCLEMLEHVPDPISIIASAATLLKPNGDLFFSTINRNLKAYLFAIVGAEYLLKLLPKNTHDFEKFIRPSELTEWAQKYDLRVQTMRGISYNPITKQYKLTDDVSVNYLIHFKKV